MLLLVTLVIVGCGRVTRELGGLTETTLRSTAGPKPSRCPAGPDAPPSQSAHPELLDQQTLMPDFQAVSAYGAAHPDEYGGARLNNDVTPSRLQAAFTGHVTEHARALRALLPHPERVDVEQVKHSVAELGQILSELRGELESLRVLSISVGWEAVDIDMPPGQELLANDYIKRWGDALRVRMGGQLYIPEGCGPQPAPTRCADLTGLDPAVAGIALTVVPDTPTIPASETGRAQLVIRNIGSGRFTIDSGIPILGVLVLPGTNHVVGHWVGQLGGVGGGVDLAPGQEGAIPVMFGAARCDGQRGTALPPGEYGLRVGLTAEGPSGGPVYLSPEAIIGVTG